ncbi:MAG: hypothetical protein WCV90_01345 [Candidatus Woesearchaeota archaeon]|jgi:hypothetical protein
MTTDNLYQIEDYRRREENSLLEKVADKAVYISNITPFILIPGAAGMIYNGIRKLLDSPQAAETANSLSSNFYSSGAYDFVAAGIVISATVAIIKLKDKIKVEKRISDAKIRTIDRTLEEEDN